MIGRFLIGKASIDVRADVTDDDDDDDAKDGCGVSSGDHVVRFFIINNISRTTSHASDDDDDDDDDDRSSQDESSTTDLIVEQASPFDSSAFRNVRVCLGNFFARLRTEFPQTGESLRMSRWGKIPGKNGIFFCCWSMEK